MCGCMCNGRSVESEANTGSIISQMNSLEATGSAQLKVHTTMLATGKNTSLLSRLDKIETEV